MNYTANSTRFEPVFAQFDIPSYATGIIMVFIYAIGTVSSVLILSLILFHRDCRILSNWHLANLCVITIIFSGIIASFFIYTLSTGRIIRNKNLVPDYRLRPSGLHQCVGQYACGDCTSASDFSGVHRIFVQHFQSPLCHCPTGGQLGSGHSHFPLPFSRLRRPIRFRRTLPALHDQLHRLPYVHIMDSVTINLSIMYDNFRFNSIIRCPLLFQIRTLLSSAFYTDR